MTERTPGVWRLRAYVGRDSKGRPVQVSQTVRGGKRAAEAALARLVADAEGRNPT